MVRYILLFSCIFRSRFKDSLRPHWKTLSNLLLNSDLEVAMVTINILNYVPVPSTLPSGEVVQICGGLVTFFFRVLEIEGKEDHYNTILYTSGLEKSLVLPVLDRFLKLKTDLFLNKKLKNRSIKLCFSQDFAIYRLTLSPVKIVHT